MQHARKNYDEAERQFKKALELDPKHANNTGNFAVFMQHARKNYDEAERLHRKALELDPNNEIASGNLAGLVLAKGNVDEARGLIEKSRTLNADNKNQLRAELLLYSALARAVSAENPAGTLHELRVALHEGFERDDWSFDFLWDAYKTKLDPTDFERFVSFADAIIDTEKAKVLTETLKQIDADSGTPKPKRSGRKKNANP